MTGTGGCLVQRMHTMKHGTQMLRTRGVTQTGPFAGYHRQLVSNMEKATRAARDSIGEDNYGVSDTTTNAVDRSQHSR